MVACSGQATADGTYLENEVLPEEKPELPAHHGAAEAKVRPHAHRYRVRPSLDRFTTAQVPFRSDRCAADGGPTNVRTTASGTENTEDN